MKRVENLRRMSDDQLRNRLVEIGNSLQRAVGKVKAGGVYSKDSMFIRKLKKERARIFTILTERKLKHSVKEK